MQSQRLEDIDFSFQNYEIGMERYVRCAWAMHIYSHHIFRENLSDSFFRRFNQINAELGVAVETTDLREHKGNYQLSLNLNKAIEETEYPKLIWFFGVEALKESDFSGWLRSHLTVRTIQNLRVIFVIDSHKEFQAVFGDNRAPFYQSTVLLRNDMADVSPS